MRHCSRDKHIDTALALDVLTRTARARRRAWMAVAFVSALVAIVTVRAADPTMFSRVGERGEVLDLDEKYR